MSREQFEKDVLRTASLFAKVTDKLNKKNMNYMFIGFFANLAHNHFRTSHYFDLAIAKSDYVIFRRMMRGLNFLEDLEEGSRVYKNGFLWWRVKFVPESDFVGRVRLRLNSFEHEMLLWFPSLEVHRKYLSSLGFLGKEDLRLLDSPTLKDNKHRLDALFSQYLSSLFIRR